VLAALRKDHPGARLLFVGGGPLSAKMRALASAMGLSDAVLFAGPVSNAEVFGLLKAVDILLVPSWREGLPGVVLEAFAAQTPVVATAVGGIPEVVSHEGTGLLAPAGADAELAALCGRLVDDDVLRRRLVRRAFERVQAFPAARLVDARARVYHELAS
jgi:glycosyltransferase involved in cell wall biosynthesis